jgi:hypothetical protein
MPVWHHRRSRSPRIRAAKYRRGSAPLPVPQSRRPWPIVLPVCPRTSKDHGSPLGTRVHSPPWPRCGRLCGCCQRSWRQPVSRAQSLPSSTSRSHPRTCRASCRITWAAARALSAIRSEVWRSSLSRSGSLQSRHSWRCELARPLRADCHPELYRSSGSRRSRCRSLTDGRLRTRAGCSGQGTRKARETTSRPRSVPVSSSDR